MNKLYNDTAVQAIANAIRAKNGSSDTYTIAEMSTALNDISYYAKPIISNVPIATFEADGLPLNSLKVSVVAKQASGTPSPSNPLPISGWDAANVSDVGKNKADKNGTILNAYLDGTTALIKSNGNNKCIVIAVKASTTYTLSLMRTALTANDDDYQIGVYSSLPTYDSTGTRLAYGIMAVGSRTSVTVTTLSDTAYMVVKYANINNTNVNATLDTLQLEEGSTATTYEPYNGVTTTISLPQTVYGGELDVVNGTSGNKNTHGYVDLGTLTWYYVAPQSGKPLPQFSAAITGGAESVSTNCISSQYLASDVPVYSRNVDDTICTFRSTVYICDSRFSDAASFKTAMSGVQLVYELATPTTLTTQPTPIKSLNGQNNLSVDCGEVIELEYIKEV